MIPRFHYGWLVASVLFLCFTLVVGILQYSFGVFVTPLEEEFGWSRTEINISVALFAFTGITAPFIGGILDRVGSRPVMIVSLGLLALSYLLRPWMTELWQFYALSIVGYAGMPGSVMLPVGKLIGIWFPESRGRALGLTAMGANFGGFIFASLTDTLIDTVGWEQSYFLYGALFLIVIPFVFLFIRETPRTTPAADDTAEGQRGPVNGVILTGLSASAALRTRAFMFVAIGLLFASITYQSVLTQIVPHLESIGISRVQAAGALSVMAIFGMMGKVLLGYLTEKFPARHVFIGSLAMQITAMIIMVTAGTSPLLWVFIPIFGIGFGGMGSLFPLIIQDTFGLKAFASIFGLVNFFILPAALFGPPLVGMSFDATGGYTTAFLTISALFVVGAVFFAFAKPPSGSDEKQNEEQEVAKATS